MICDPQYIGEESIAQISEVQRQSRDSNPGLADPICCVVLSTNIDL